MKTNNLSKIFRLALVALTLLLVAGLIPSNVLAGDEEDVTPINTVPKVYSQTAIEQNLSESRGIPWFNGAGTIDQVLSNGFVVDDMTLIGSNVDFRSEASGQALPSASFRPGVKVGYVLDSKNKLVSLWKLKKQ